MLKIKDNVDMKELENFGFKIKHLINDTYYYSTKSISNDNLVIFCNRKILQEYISSYDGFRHIKINDIIFDLIKADLVEKVVDK